ncbi:AEC family transporter [Thermoanaerobacter uzonensis]|uniref:AEC family transporter n=1 Tax=Thermoanaerobacter uzonensis TaxID=447593 RepID=UPI003D769FEF
MEHFIIVEKILLNIGIILLGYLFKRLKIIPDNAGDVLSKIVLYITLPATILIVFSEHTINLHLLILPIISILLGLLTFLLGYFIVKKVKLDDKDKWTLLVSICGYNIGLFALPFIQQVYGSKGVMTISMFDIGNSFIVFGLAYAVAFLGSDKENFNLKEVIRKIIFFFPLDIYLLSLLMNFLNIKLGGIVKDFIYQLSIPNSFLALFTIGYFLDFNLNKDELKALGIGMFVKFLPGIILFLLLAFLFDTSQLIVKIIAIGSILPTPMVAVVYSNERGLNPKLASVFITMSIVIGVILMSIVMLKW